MKKFAAWTALFALLVGMLAGCSKNGEEGKDAVMQNQPQTLTGTIYVPTFSQIDGVTGDVSQTYVGKDSIYFTVYEETVVTHEPENEGEEPWDEYVYETTLWRADLDGKNATKLENYTMPEAPSEYGGANLQQILPDPNGGVWVFESIWETMFETPEDFDPNTGDIWQYYTGDRNEYHLRKLDDTGTETGSIDLSALGGTSGSGAVNGGGVIIGSTDTAVAVGRSGMAYINYIAMDASGNVYLLGGETGTQLCVYDSNGTELFNDEISSNGWVNSMFTLADGSVALLLNDENGNQIYTFDLAAKQLSDPQPAPYSAYMFYPGGGEYDLYYNLNTSFYGMKLGEETGEKLFSWIDCDINSDYVQNINVLPDGQILCTYRDWNSGDSAMQLVTLTPKDASEVPQKQILRLAAIYLDWNLRNEIIEFNKQSTDVRITVTDYSEYNTEEDYTAGLTKLTTEITSGNIPDILCTNSLPIDRYAAKGLLEDLWPYIDNDGELSRDALVTPVFDAMSIDGKLYQTASTFSIQTAAGHSSVVGDQMGWTLEQMMAAKANMPEGAQYFDYYTTRDTVMSYLGALMMDQFVDWDTGTCSFNTEPFMQLLEFSKEFPEEFDWENYDYTTEESEFSRLRNGKQMLYNVYLSDITTLQMANAMFDNQATFVGLPTADGSFGAAFYLDNGMAMTTACANKDAAWQFLRRLLLPEYQEQNSWSFPTNKEAFDAVLEQAMEKQYYEDENGNQIEQPVTTWGWGEGEEIEIYAATQADIDQFMEILNNTKFLMNYDTDVLNIVNEEAAAFYAGQKSAQDVASVIQSRVQIYVSEQS